MNTSVTLLSTGCFPPIEYMAILVKQEQVLLDIHETWRKQTWRNRYTILTGNGPVSLTIPVEKPRGNHTKTNEVTISDHAPWQKTHWASIHSAYRNAPFFLYYKELVYELIFKNVPSLLWQFNDRVISSIFEEWGRPYPVGYTKSFIPLKNDFTDRRFSISPKERDRKGFSVPQFKPYYQVFSDRFGFIPNASILDLVFNLGPDTYDYLSSV